MMNWILVALCAFNVIVAALNIRATKQARAARDNFIGTSKRLETVIKTGEKQIAKTERAQNTAAQLHQWWTP